MKVGKIKAEKVLFINLGRQNKFAIDCITNNYLKLGYNEIDHKMCLNKQWSEVYKSFIQNPETDPPSATGAATRHKNQIQQFYEETESTLWITFYDNKLWWCFSNPVITLQPDLTKTRPVIGKWSDSDINGKALTADNISGKLLATQAYRGTICEAAEKKYIIDKINGESKREIHEVKDAFIDLKIKLAELIKHLSWGDFEILVDLILNRSGWQRISSTGKTQKDYDIILQSPLTGEKAGVQIKAKSDFNLYDDYVKKFNKMKDELRYSFYFVHTTEDKKLSNYRNDNNSDKTILYIGEDIAELAISSGLVGWIIKKTI